MFAVALLSALSDDRRRHRDHYVIVDTDHEEIGNTRSFAWHVLLSVLFYQSLDLNLIFKVNLPHKLLAYSYNRYATMSLNQLFYVSFSSWLLLPFRLPVHTLGPLSFFCSSVFVFIISCISYFTLFAALSWLFVRF